MMCGQLNGQPWTALRLRSVKGHRIQTMGVWKKREMLRRKEERTQSGGGELERKGKNQTCNSLCLIDYQSSSTPPT